MISINKIEVEDKRDWKGGNCFILFCLEENNERNKILVRYLTKCESMRRNKFKKWHQFSSVAESCMTLCYPMDCSMPGFHVHHQLPELTQIHVHRISDAIQPPHPLSSPSPPTFNLSQHQGLFQWVSSSHEVAKVLEFQLQHQSFQWIFRTDFL